MQDLPAPIMITVTFSTPRPKSFRDHASSDVREMIADSFGAAPPPPPSASTAERPLWSTDDPVEFWSPVQHQVYRIMPMSDLFVLIGRSTHPGECQRPRGIPDALSSPTVGRSPTGQPMHRQPSHHRGQLRPARDTLAKSRSTHTSQRKAASCRQCDRSPPRSAMHRYLLWTATGEPRRHGGNRTASSDCTAPCRRNARATQR